MHFGESSRSILGIGINSVRNGCETYQIINLVHTLNTKIPMLGLFGDIMTNIESDNSSVRQRYFIHL